MGRRYLVALTWVFATLAVLVGTGVGLSLLVKNRMQNLVEEWEKSIPKLKMAEAEMGHEMKTVAASRMLPPRPRMVAVKDGTTSMPEIVETTKNDIRFGLDMEEEMNGTVTASENEMLESLEELDSLYEEKLADLPVAGPRLQPTEVVEQMPKFPGGIGALMKWLDTHVIYPHNCIKNKIGGELQVTFLVDIDGTVRDPKISFSLHPDLDRAALYAIRRMPKWEPGRVNGQLSVVSVTLPVHFQPR